MSRLISAFVLCIVLFTSLFGNAIALPLQAQADTNNYCISTEEQALIDLINQHRESEELPPLIASKSLGAAAKDKSEEMRDLSYTDVRGNTQIGYFDQVSPSGIDAVENATAFGYYNGYVGQNILREEIDAENVFQILRSDVQRDNMLNPNFLAIGVGYAEGSGPDGGEPTNLWTTVYGGQILTEDVATPCEASQNTPTPTVSPIPTQTPSPTSTPTVTPTATATPPPVTPDPTSVPLTPTEVVPTPTEVVPTPTIVTGERDILCTGKVKADGSVVISCVSAPIPPQ